MAWELGARVAEAAGCAGEPGTILACLQGIEDGFAILEASDYGPYANLDTVKTLVGTKRYKEDVDFGGQDLGDEAFLPLPPREALQSGQVAPSCITLPQMQPLDLILGFNKDEGLHVILDLLMDPDNDTNFALVTLTISTITYTSTSPGSRQLGDPCSPHAV